MDYWLSVDWGKLFTPEVPLLEIFLRGTLTYLGLFLLLRVILKREAGTIGISDLLVVVLIADAAQNSMAGDYQSITDGLLLVGTIIFWSYILNWLGYRFPVLEPLVHPPALLLVRDGQMLWQNMRKEFITEEELRSMLRAQGVEDIQEVRKAYMEGDGRISVITEDKRRHEAPQKKAK